MLSIYVWIQHTKPHTEHKAVRRFASLFPKRGPDKNTTPTCVGFALNVIACTSCRASASSSSTLSHIRIFAGMCVGLISVCLHADLVIYRKCKWNTKTKSLSACLLKTKTETKRSALGRRWCRLFCRVICWLLAPGMRRRDAINCKLVSSQRRKNIPLFGELFFRHGLQFLEVDIFDQKYIRSDCIEQVELLKRSMSSCRWCIIIELFFYYLNLIKMQKMSYFKLVFRLDDWIFSEIKLQTAFLNRITLINS